MHAHVDSLSLLLTILHVGFYLVAAVAAIFCGALVASKLSPSDPSLDLSAWDPVPCTRRPESPVYTLAQCRLAESRAARRAAISSEDITVRDSTRPIGLLPHPEEIRRETDSDVIGGEVLMERFSLAQILRDRNESQSLGDWLWDVSTPESASEDADNRPPPTPRRPDTLLCEGIVAGGEIPLNLLDWNGQPL
jgi:hypothetical protein